jgi:glycosyltransferase involved in cell wall biosynthesis
MDTGSTIYENKLTYYTSHIKNINLHVITIGNENKQFKEDNLIIHMIETRKLFYVPFLTPILHWNMKRKIMDINPDIVHVISTSYIYSPVAAFLRDKFPTVLTVYGIGAKEIKYNVRYYKHAHQFISALFAIINEKYVLSKIPNIIADAPSIKDLISKWTKSKIYVVPDGIEYDKIERTPQHTLANKSPDIFIVANLEKLKGVDILIRAIPKVIEAIPNLSMRIAGYGPEENELKKLVKELNLEDHVTFLGYVSEEDKFKNCLSSKITVVPSRWDCLPITLLEAMACGKCIIASNVGGIPDVIEDGVDGLLFESENVEDLADKIITLLKDEKLREDMGRAAKEKAKQYDWSKIAERTVEIYKDVIADFYERKAKNKQKRKTL